MLVLFEVVGKYMGRKFTPKNQVVKCVAAPTNQESFLDHDDADVFLFVISVLQCDRECSKEVRCARCADGFAATSISVIC